MPNKSSSPAKTHETQPVHQPGRPGLQRIPASGEKQPGPAGALQRAVQDPAGLSPQEILSLQRGVGNRAVTALLKPSSHVLPIQKKLTVGAADDAYEREADRVAMQVVSAEPGSLDR